MTKNLTMKLANFNCDLVLVANYELQSLLLKICLPNFFGLMFGVLKVPLIHLMNGKPIKISLFFSLGSNNVCWSKEKNTSQYYMVYPEDFFINCWSTSFHWWIFFNLRNCAITCTAFNWWWDGLQVHLKQSIFLVLQMEGISWIHLLNKLIVKNLTVDERNCKKSVEEGLQLRDRKFIAWTGLFGIVDLELFDERQLYAFPPFICLSLSPNFAAFQDK